MIVKKTMGLIGFNAVGIAALQSLMPPARCADLPILDISRMYPAAPLKHHKEVEPMRVVMRHLKPTGSTSHDHPVHLGVEIPLHGLEVHFSKRLFAVQLGSC